MDGAEPSTSCNGISLTPSTGVSHDRARDRFERTVDRGAPRAPRRGEGVYPRTRSFVEEAPRTALGQGREELPVSRRRRASHAFRLVRRAQPARRLSLHVRSGLEGGLSRLLAAVRSRRRRPPALRTQRFELCRRLARAHRKAASLSPPDGLEFPLGVRRRLRLQSGLPRLLP